MSRYTDCPFLNEYVIDDFLVSDDDPILYETQGTATESLVNLNHYDTMSRASTFSLSLESDSSPPRRRYSRRQRARQQIPSSQEVERQQRAEAERHALQGRNRRRIVVESDNEEEIEDSEENQPVNVDHERLFMPEISDDDQDQQQDQQSLHTVPVPISPSSRTPTLPVSPSPHTPALPVPPSSRTPTLPMSPPPPRSSYFASTRSSLHQQPLPHTSSLLHTSIHQ